MSFLSNIVSSRIRLPGASQHELPMYNSPPQSPVSFPPLPIAASVYGVDPTPHQDPRASVVVPQTTALDQTEDMIILRRRERQLETDLQDLLDLQSDALLSGSSHAQSTPSESDFKSVDSGTPRIHSPARSHDDDYLSPKHPQVMSPAMARRGIYRSIRELAAVKGREEEIAQREVRHCRSMQRQLQGWDKKRMRLRQEVSNIKERDDRLRTQRLQSEADKLQDEITQTEQKLAVMRQRHRALVNEIAEIDNSVQSKLTSYVASLNMLEEDIHRYLANPPDSLIKAVRTDSPLLSLPTKRRTLEMTQDAISSQAKTLESDTKIIKDEKQALLDGSKLWKSCISKVETFEKHLRQQMTALGNNAGSSLNNMSDLLSGMDHVINSLARDLELARSHNWNLLVACIGAELEAFQQGRAILRRAAGVAEEQDDDRADHDVVVDDDEQVQSRTSLVPGLDNDDAEEDNTSETVWNTPRASRVLRPQHHDDEDDAPDPELMFSPQADNDND